MKKFWLCFGLLSILLVNVVICVVALPTNTDISLQMDENSGQSYADFNGVISGTLVRGNSDNSVQLQLTPTFFDTHTGLLGTVYTVISATVTNIQFIFYEYDSSNNQIGSAQGSILNTDNVFSLNQQQTVTLSNINIDSNAMSITFTVSVSGELEQEINNNPTNTRYVQASGSTLTYSGLQTVASTSDTLIYVIVIILAIIGTGAVLFGGYTMYKRSQSKNNVNTRQQLPSIPQSSVNVGENMFCTNCGTKNSKTSTYCSSCGQKLR